MAKITSINAREILDSRGDPTVEVELELDNGIKTIASVPSGASVGSHEAIELRDSDQNRFRGLGVLKAIDNIKNTIAPTLIGQEVEDQASIDQTLINLDGTPHKSKLGANAILAISIAVCKAASNTKNMPLFKYIAELSNTSELKMPVPMFNFVEGAKHADNNLVIQEFLAISSKENFSENYRHASETFHALGKILKNRGVGVAVGHEGGYAPMLPSDEEAIKAIQEAGDMKIGLDMAGVVPNGLTIESIINTYGVISMEDPANEDSWDEWSEITRNYGSKALIIGDDIFATNVERLKEGVQKGAGNAVIVKPNQVGTISQTIDFAKNAKENNYKIVVSHRSGETEDTFIADFAIGIGADFVKFGAPSRGERVSKYNRLLRIEEALG